MHTQERIEGKTGSYEPNPHSARTSPYTPHRPANAHEGAKANLPKMKSKLRKS